MLGEQETRPDVFRGVMVVSARVLHRLRGLGGALSDGAELRERRGKSPDAGLDRDVGAYAGRDRKARGKDPVLGYVGLELIQPALDLVDLAVAHAHLAVNEQPTAERCERIFVLDVVLQYALADDHLGLVREEQAHEVEKVAVTLRATARLLALVGNISGGGTLAVATLLASLLDLAAAVTELRQAQQHAEQAAAARRAAEHLHCAHTRARSRAAQPGWAAQPEHAGRTTAPAAARNDFPGPFRLEDALLDDPAVASHHSRPGPAVGPSRRAGPSP